MVESVFGKEMLSFHKGSQLRQPPVWVPVSACFTSTPPPTQFLPPFLLPVRPLFALNDFHVEVSPFPPLRVNIYGVNSTILQSL